MGEGFFSTECRGAKGGYFLILIPLLRNNLCRSFCMKTVRTKTSYVSMLVSYSYTTDHTDLLYNKSGLSMMKHKLICILTNGEVSALCKNTKG